MAIHFVTQKAKELLASFNARIDQKEEKGKITTWEKVVANSTTYYTHKAKDWHGKAYFRPSVENNQLTFNIIRPKDESVSIDVYGYYHGHLTETFLNHFDKNFTSAVSSALPESNDDVSAKK